LYATIGLTGFKFGVAYLSNSLGVLSEAVHSLLDLVSAAISFFTIRHAVKPADHDHPFGHGKYENVSSFLEALLLLVAGALIIYEGVDHLKNPHEVVHGELAIAVIFISMIVSWYMYKHNSGAARDTESPALHVNALHFLSDVIASAGVLVGLVMLRITHWAIIDPIIAFFVAAYILWISISQVRASFRELTDIQLPESEIRHITEILDEFKDRTIEAHDLRTRRSGVVRHIDFHLVVCGDMTVDESHSVCDDMEAKILEKYPGSSINIHVEPCERSRTDCHLSCPVYNGNKSRRESVF
jgi:cation diffusion facilitator family transporter